MAKTIAIMQPTYLPWLGYFDLIRRSDVFVLYNSVQFDKRSWQQRNRIRNKAGELMLTVPVKTKGDFEQKIADVLLDNPKAALHKHLKTIQQSYAKAPNFARFMPGLEEVYGRGFLRLQDLNFALIKFGMEALHLKTEVVFSSELETGGTKVEGLLNICKKLGATAYLSPQGSRTYIEENNLFPENRIALRYHEYEHPHYQQLNYSDFISHLSFIDYLFNSPQFS